MKYKNEIIINLSRKKVIELFDNAENMKHWQPGLQSYEFISGTPGEVGSKMKLKFKMNNRGVEMVETITRKNLPDEFSGSFEMKGVVNRIENKFYEISENKTKWVAENEFHFAGFMKIIGFLFPGMFKKQSQKYLEQFRTFAESNA